MKRPLSQLAAAAFAAIILLAFAGCDRLIGAERDKTTSGAQSEGNIDMPGAPSAARVPIQREVEFFQKAMTDFEGILYEPTLVSKQTIGGGFNYFFQATATPNDTDIEPYTVIIDLFVGYDGVELELKRITQVAYDEDGKLIRSEIKYP